MTNSYLVAWTFAVALILFGIRGVSGQNYPNKPIRIVSPPAGGGNDVSARLISQGLTDGLAQPVVVDNRTGVIAAEIVAKAVPDGYTLLMYSGTLWLGPLFRKMPYDAVKDFAPITWISRAPDVLVVHPSVPVKSVKDLVAYAKARPGELSYASGPDGATNHLAAELFKYMTGVNFVRITYKGGVQALNGLLGGETQVMFASSAAMGPMVPFVRLGKLKALAATSAEPSALFPELPTVAASGLPGYEAQQVVGMFAPAKTAEAIITRLNHEIVRVLNGAGTKERFLSFGVEIVGSTPAQFGAMIKSEISRISQVIKSGGIRVE